MRSVAAVFLGLLFCYLLFVGYLNRALLFSRFDEVYWKNRYEQSQWVLPLSQRTLGDDGLFLYEGARLIKGDDPSLYNPEVPPLGKYAIGASVKYLGNGYWYAFLITASCILVFFWLARMTLPTAWIAGAVTLLFAFDPLVASQFSVTMLDSVQLLFLLLYFVCIIHISHAPQKPSLLSVVCAGALAGLFSETKFPLLTPLLLTIGGITIARSRVRIRMLSVFLLSFGVAYVLPYTRYFQIGHTFIDWLKLQKSAVAFYGQSALAPTFGSAITSLLANQSQNLFTRAWETSGSWTPVWTLLFFVVFGAIAGKHPSKPTRFGSMVGFAILSLLLYSLVPFWQRYLLTVIPFLYLLGGAMLGSLRRGLFIVFISVAVIVNLLASWPVFFPSSESVTRQFIYDWEHGFFADMYERISTDTRMGSREEFDRFGKQAFLDAEIESVTVSGRNPVTLTYHTQRLGAFTHHVTLPLAREDGQWKIAWKWNLLFPNFSPGHNVKTTVIPATRGTIQAQGLTLAQDVPGLMVWVTPKDVDTTKEPQLLTLLSTAFLQPIKEVRIHHRYVANTLADRPIAIGVINARDTKTVAALQAFAGVRLTPALARWHNPASIMDLGQLKNTAYDECCSWLYNTTNYDGVSGLEGEKNAILKGQIGGSLVIYDREGRVVETLIAQKAKNGISVYLP